MFMINTLKFIFAEAIILIVWHLLLEFGLNPVQILGLLIKNQYLLLCIDTIIISLLTTTLATHTLKWNNWRAWIVSLMLIIVISSFSEEPFFSFCTSFNMDDNIFCLLFAFNVLIQVLYVIIYILLNILCPMSKARSYCIASSILLLMSPMDGFAKLRELYTHTFYKAFHLDYHFDGGYMSVRPSNGATPSGQAPVYYANCYYFIRDHQGNNRLVVDGSDNIEQTNNYFPYGGPWGGSTDQGFQPFKYNGRSALCDASHLKKGRRSLGRGEEGL